MKKLFLFVLVAGLCSFTYPQSGKMHSHNKKMEVMNKSAVKLPAGWKMRFDKTFAGGKDVKVVEDMGVYHFTSDPVGAAIYYNPKNEEKAQFKIEADFTQLKPSKHPEAYGVFFAGTNLQKHNQYYLYFLVRQDGKYLIKKRIGNNTKLVVGWTPSKYVNAENKKGQTINKIYVTVGKTDVTFGANGKEVVSLSNKKLGSTDGIVGLRINHNLDVITHGLTIKKQ